MTPELSWREKARKMAMERRYGKDTTRTLTIYQVQQLANQYFIASLYGNHFTRVWYARQAHNLFWESHFMRIRRQFETEIKLPELTKKQMYCFRQSWQ